MHNFYLIHFMKNEVSERGNTNKKAKKERVRRTANNTQFNATHLLKIAYYISLLFHSLFGKAAVVQSHN